jgi:molybdopterin synthase catalytic subunit
MKITRVGIHSKQDITIEEIFREVREHEDIGKAGMIGCFVGIVRGVTDEGEKVKYLEYEAYEEVAEEKLREIAGKMSKKKGIVDVWIHHIIGRRLTGEDVIYVVVAGDHRYNVFPVLEETVELVKKNVPIWKKEVTERESYWVHRKNKKAP